MGRRPTIQNTENIFIQIMNNLQRKFSYNDTGPLSETFRTDSALIS
jgi:negative regulator of genetic competence, sporulation and motility